MQVEVEEGQRSLAVNTEVTKMFLIIIFISPSNAKVTIIVIACAGILGGSVNRGPSI
jgi:hypothetical protein